eukprot:763731-Hanusia_phi.AAC.4
MPRRLNVRRKGGGDGGPELEHANHSYTHPRPPPFPPPAHPSHVGCDRPPLGTANGPSVGLGEKQEADIGILRRSERMEAMMQRVGRGVEVELADDTRRKGFVYTVDPLSHNAVMLVRPDIGAEEVRNWRACMIFKDALKSVSGPWTRCFAQADLIRLATDSHISEIEFVALERDHPLTRQGHDEEQDPVKVAETLEVIKRNLNAVELLFTADIC